VVLCGHLQSFPDGRPDDSGMGVAVDGGIRKQNLFLAFESKQESLSHLSFTQTTQALVKETLAARKNVSPQNHYETSQLYVVGALRVACIGLQCVGFSDAVYHGVLEQARYVQWSRAAALPTARQGTPCDDVKPAAN